MQKVFGVNNMFKFKRMIGDFLRFVYYRIKFLRRLSIPFSSTIGINSEFEGANKIYHHSFFKGSIGYGSYIGHDCEICAQIGRFTSIAPYVRTNHGVHPYKEPYVSTCPMFYSTQKQCGSTYAERNMFNEFLQVPQIGNDCWIGENVFICGDVKIGDGAVVLAGAVVTENVPDYAIVGGVPAKIIEYRYDEETRNFFAEIKWWNNDLVWFKKNWRLMSDIQALKDFYKQNIS